MQVYHDQDADLSLLEGRRIAVIGYGNQGRAQALNLRDSGLEVVIGNREDGYAERAREDGLPVLAIDQASAGADVVMMLIPDEAAPAIFEALIAPHLAEKKILVFASGYNVAFGFITPPPSLDVVLVAPRMIGAGVRDLYLAGRGFPSFIGVAQDHSGQAREIARALAKGIGSTRAGVVEVTFAQEAELDLFTEQCFGPAFGHVLTTAVDLLLEEGYPPEAVLLELYMSGELSFTLGAIAELGMIEFLPLPEHHALVDNIIELLPLFSRSVPIVCATTLLIGLLPGLAIALLAAHEKLTDKTIDTHVRKHPLVKIPVGRIHILIPFQVPVARDNLLSLLTEIVINLDIGGWIHAGELRARSPQNHSTRVVKGEIEADIGF